IAPGGAEDERETAREILESVVTDALDYRGRAGTAHQESLPDDARDVQRTRGSAIANDVASNNVPRGGMSGLRVRSNHHLASGKSLADVVIGIADETQGNTVRKESSERLARRPRQRHIDRFCGKPC